MNPDQLADLVIYYQSPVFLIRQDHRSLHLSAGVRGSVTHCGTVYECRESLRRAEADRFDMHVVGKGGASASPSTLTV